MCPSAMKFFNMSKKTGSFGFSSCHEMAKAIVENIDPAENDAIEKIELSQAGKGPIEKSGFFLNITLKNEFIEKRVQEIYASKELTLAGGCSEESKEAAAEKMRVLVDFSSPNIAKNMHVGHLRSTI